MAEAAAPDYERGLTFEQVLAGIQELRESQKETDRQMKETDRRMKETDQRLKQTERLVKETSKRMGDLNNRFGEIAEHLVAPGIAKRFNELGFHFDSILPGGIKILDEKKKIKAEIDLLLENGETIIAIEVKARAVRNDIEHHIRRLEILKEYRSKRNDTRKIHGAIAGAVFGSAEKKAALDAGFFVLEQSGDTMKLELPEGFVPREW